MQVVRKLDPRQFIRLASEAAPKINVNTNVSWGEEEIHVYYIYVGGSMVHY